MINNPCYGNIARYNIRDIETRLKCCADFFLIKGTTLPQYATIEIFQHELMNDPCYVRIRFSCYNTLWGIDGQESSKLNWQRLWIWIRWLIWLFQIQSILFVSCFKFKPGDATFRDRCKLKLTRKCCSNLYKRWYLISLQSRKKFYVIFRWWHV